MKEKTTELRWQNSLKWLIGIFVIVVIAATVAFRYWQFNQQPTATVAPVSIAPIVTLVLAVNLDNIQAVTADKIESGLIPILAIHENPNIANHNYDVISFINQFAQLVFFDSDKNGRIDMSDPVFTRLELIFLMPAQNKIKCIPIRIAGIRAIILDKPELIHFAITGQLNKLPEVNNVVLLANGSLRSLRVIPIKQSLLP